LYEDVPVLNVADSAAIREAICNRVIGLSITKWYNEVRLHSIA